MRIWYFPFLWTIVLDCIAWFAIHMGVSYIITQIRLEHFNPQSWSFRKRDWEKEGRFYRDIFFVKKWKGLLPEGAALFGKGFRKKQLQEKGKYYFSTFAQETCRSEYTHLMTIVFAPLFSCGIRFG